MLVGFIRGWIRCVWQVGWFAFDACRTPSVQPLKNRTLEFEQLPDVRPANEDKEDEDSSQDVQQIRRDPKIKGTANKIGDYLGSPENTHQDEYDQNRAESEKLHMA